MSDGSVEWNAAATPRRVTPGRAGVHVALLAATVLTTTIAGANWAGVDAFESPRAMLEGLPFAIALLAILLCHEFGHYLMCVYHGVDASLPYVIPGPPLLPLPGTFGAVIRIRSRWGDRRALFDVGAGGPWAGFVVAVVVMVIGLRLSHVAGPSEAGGIEFGDSLLTAFLTRAILSADPDTVIVHPLAVAGWFGLFITSLNLLPIGQLDGGHIVYSAVGRPTPALAGLLAAGLVWLGLRGWPGWFLWAGILGVMAVLGHPKTIDDRVPLGLPRLVGAVLSLIVFVITFVPEPIRIIP
jgi:membrane-associated protease RseP (regulator of RpoE activity)